MELSEELLALKNAEIRMLIEQLYEKDKLIRTITINHATYLDDYESRWGRYIDEFDNLENELYQVKNAYYELIKTNYERRNIKDEATELKLKKLEKEIAELKKQIDNSISNQEIIERVLKQPLSDQKQLVQQLQWLLRGSNFDKIDAKLIERVTKALNDYEVFQMKNAYGDYYSDSPLLPYIVNPQNASQIINILLQNVRNTGNKDYQAFPIRAGINVGVIRRIPWKEFKKIFPLSSISETRYNAILNTENIDKALIVHSDEIQKLVELFRAIGETE